MLKICTPEKFRELTESQRTSMLIDAYRSGENPDAKSQLAAFVFMGYDPALLAGKRGKRHKSSLKSTGLVMTDFDHIDHPHQVYETFLKSMPRLGMTLEHDLALAHITPSEKGLRLVVRIPKGKSVVQMQQAIGKLVGVECDKAVKDLSRLSFVPKAEDILYMNKTLLFGAIQNSPEGTELLINPVQPMEQREQKVSLLTLCRVATEEDEVRRSAGIEGSPTTDAAQRDAPSRFPAEYHGVPYKAIVEKWIELRGGKPEPGDRHATLVELAMDLRKICDNDKEWIASLMPDFDKGEQEKQDCIEWAVGRQHSKISGTLLDALAAFGIERTTDGQKYSNVRGSESYAEGGTGSFTTKDAQLTEQAEADALPPAMPKELPSLVALMTSKVLDHQKPAVASMMFPALAAHVNNCQFRLRDNTPAELSLMCCLFAPQSVGKGCVKAPLRLIMSDIKAQDKVNRQRERDWQESQKNKKANEKGKSRPDDIVIRILSSDTTPAAFLGRLMAAEHGDGFRANLCTYSQVDEIEDLYRFCQSGGRNMVQQMIKRTWDRDDIGAERFTANAANISTVLRWNWAASSTIEGGKKFFKHCLTDGTLSRVDFCTIIQPDRVIDDFCYGDYDAEFRARLRPYIDNLKRFECDTDEDGEVIPKLFPQVREMEVKMNRYINSKSSTMPDSTWENYAWRAKVMAIKKLIVLYIANGEQWEDSFEDFVWWTFDYNMWCKMNLFYDAASAAFQDERLQGNKGHRSPLKYMRRTFTYADFAHMCQQQGFKQKPDAILRKYKSRGVIAYNDDKTYTIEPEYAKKFGMV